MSVRGEPPGVWLPALRTEIEKRAPFPVVGGGWISRARKMPSEPVGEHWIAPRARGSRILSNRILAAGQHRGSTSAIRTALNALAAN